MKNWKKILMLAVVLVAVVGCGEVPTLKNGDQKVASLEKGGISADSLYDAMKSKYGAATFVDLLDQEILGKKYKEDSVETEYVENQMNEIKTSAEQNKTTVDAIISYYGFKDKNAFKDYIRLSYRRDKAVNEYVEKTIKDKEIKEYYENEIYGEIKLKHILISPDTSDDMTSEEKENAEKDAKKEAEKIIKKIQKGEDFDKLAKKYSDDTSNAKKGGSLGWVSKGDMVEEFDKAAFKLKKGKYTTSPVKTTYGYHIIYKEDEKKKPTLKKAKKEILEALTKQKLDDTPTLYYDALMDIRKDAGLKFEDKDLKVAYKTFMDSQKSQAESKANQN